MPYRESPPTPAVDPHEALARSVLELALLDGENLLWAGRPRLGLMFELKHVVDMRLVISILMMLAGVSATFVDIGAGRPPVGAIFLAMGFCWLFARLVVDARKRARGFGDIHVNSPTYEGQSRKLEYATPVMAQVSNANEVHRLLLEAMAAAQRA